MRLSGADKKKGMAGNRTRAKKTTHKKFMMLTIMLQQQAHFEGVWILYIYLTRFSLEIRHYIVGAEKCLQPMFHDLISISFLHGSPFDSKFLFWTYNARPGARTTKNAHQSEFKIFSSKIEYYV
jgi:hypothetical protein